jgi:DNA (cytosine-5)-methyltransferase 1
MRTVTGAHRGEHALVTPVMVRTDMHKSNAGCAYDVEDPLRTVTSGGGHAVVAPLLAPVKSWGGGGNDAAPADRPMRTTTTSKRGEFALVAPMLTKFNENSNGQPVDEPAHTVMAGATRFGVVEAALSPVDGAASPVDGDNADEDFVAEYRRRFVAPFEPGGVMHAASAAARRALRGYGCACEHTVAGAIGRSVKFTKRILEGLVANGEAVVSGPPSDWPEGVATDGHTVYQWQAPDESKLVAPTLVQTGWGERKGQAPRALDLHKPLGTVMADGQKHALVEAELVPAAEVVAPTLVGIDNRSNGDSSAWTAEEPLRTVTTENRHALVSAFMARHYGGPAVIEKQTPGRQMTMPLDTITSRDHHAVVASHLVKLKGTCKDGQPVTEPLATVQAQGLHYAAVHAFLVKYYGTDQDPQIQLPLATVTTKDRFAIVTVHGVDYVIVDIGMRMLTPRELFNAQGFPPDYVIDPVVEQKTKTGRAVKKRLTKTAQVHKCGNSVPPPFSEALVRAQFAEREEEAVA